MVITVILMELLSVTVNINLDFKPTITVVKLTFLDISPLQIFLYQILSRKKEKYHEKILQTQKIEKSLSLME